RLTADDSERVRCVRRDRHRVAPAQRHGLVFTSLDPRLGSAVEDVEDLDVRVLVHRRDVARLRRLDAGSHGRAALVVADDQLAVRLMGEDLVLYKDTRGGYGLLDRHCPHRRADLCYGVPEDRGLRCHYHGWLFDSAGACLQQPFEEIARPEARFRDKIRTTAYPVQVKAGLLWAYLGPAPAPLVPDWDLFGERGYKQIVFSEIPCNWFQGQ